MMGFLDERRCEKCGKSEEYVHLDPHHVIKRSRGGTDEDTVWLCRECHRFVELNPREAKKLGLDSKEYKITI